MRHQVEKGTFSYENKERTKREKLVRTKWAFHRFGALTVYCSISDDLECYKGEKWKGSDST